MENKPKKQRSYLNLFIRRLLSMKKDKAPQEETIASIKAGIDFRGANLWILIFAIFVASLGLNTNSAAVIIGAMLISPLMGPIVGMGLGVGIYDFELLKRAFRSFATATIFSVLTATFYFAITPINEAQSELLARTSPTIYDVLIALFGGLAGIVALCSTGQRGGNVIPGVAIATAIMPPLCTTGFGLATGNWLYGHVRRSEHPGFQEEGICGQTAGKASEAYHYHHSRAHDATFCPSYLYAGPGRHIHE